MFYAPSTETHKRGKGQQMDVFSTFGRDTALGLWKSWRVYALRKMEALNTCLTHKRGKRQQMDVLSSSGRDTALGWWKIEELRHTTEPGSSFHFIDGSLTRFCENGWFYDFVPCSFLCILLQRGWYLKIIIDQVKTR